MQIDLHRGDEYGKFDILLILDEVCDRFDSGRLFLTFQH